MLSPVFWTQDCYTNIHIVLWEHSDSVQSEILARIRTLGLYTYHSRLPTQDLQQTYVCIIQGSIATSYPLNFHVSGLYHVPFVVHFFVRLIDPLNTILQNQIPYHILFWGTLFRIHLHIHLHIVLQFFPDLLDSSVRYFIVHPPSPEIIHSA